MQKERIALKSKNSVRRKMRCLSLLKAVQALVFRNCMLFWKEYCRISNNVWLPQVQVRLRSLTWRHASFIAFCDLCGRASWRSEERMSFSISTAMACHCLFSLFRRGKSAEVAPLEYYNFSIPKGGCNASTFFHFQPSPEKRECCFDVPDYFHDFFSNSSHKKLKQPPYY